jgi:hypothetical protein
MIGRLTTPTDLFLAVVVVELVDIHHCRMV